MTEKWKEKLKKIVLKWNLFANPFSHHLLVLLHLLEEIQLGLVWWTAKGFPWSLIEVAGRKERKIKANSFGKKRKLFEKNETVKGNTIIYMFVCKCGISVENAWVSTFSSPYILAEFPFFSHYVGIHFHSYSFIRSFSM